MGAGSARPAPPPATSRTPSPLEARELAGLGIPGDGLRDEEASGRVAEEALQFHSGLSLPGQEKIAGGGNSSMTPFGCRPWRLGAVLKSGERPDLSEVDSLLKMPSRVSFGCSHARERSPGGRRKRGPSDPRVEDEENNDRLLTVGGVLCLERSVNRSTP